MGLLRKGVTNSLLSFIKVESISQKDEKLRKLTFFKAIRGRLIKIIALGLRVIH
jgi:hypothetical protein